jgi:hypothetical protein
MSLGITAAGWAAIGAVGTTAVSAYGASKAGDAQEDAARAAQSSSDRQFDISRQDTLDLLKQQREDQAPYREAGKSALAQIMADLANPAGVSATLGADPGYLFRVNEGESAIKRAAAATGAGYSGATLKALARFNSDNASSEYGARFNRLAQVAGIGQTSTNATQSAGTSANSQLNSLGTTYANRNAAILGDMGEAAASGYVARSNAIGSGIKGLYNAYQAGPWTTGGGSGSVENVLL